MIQFLIMDEDINKIIGKHCNKILVESKIEGIGIDSYSKKFNLSTHQSILAKGILNHNNLTDIAYNNGISKSQLSRLNNKGHPLYSRKYSCIIILPITPL